MRYIHGVVLFNGASYNSAAYAIDSVGWELVIKVGHLTVYLSFNCYILNTWDMCQYRLIFSSALKYYTCNKLLTLMTKSGCCGQELRVFIFYDWFI